MFQTNDSGRRFLKEALPLIATYFSGEGVVLGGVATTIGLDSDEESFGFGSYIRFRHAIACCAELFPVVQKIEGRLSSVTEISQGVTKGALRGRLDIPRYVAQKLCAFSWPRNYPILVSSEMASTPENQVVVRLFKVLLPRLQILQSPVSSAEAILARRYTSWIRNRLKRDPWVSVCSASPLSRLCMEASRRVARRQTGNEQAYSDLINFIKKWGFLEGEFLGGVNADSFLDSLLSFPADQSFFDRIYEVWCIRSVASALTQLGATLVDGPCKMTESRQRPIYKFEIESITVEVWFQCSLPSEDSEWFYHSTGKALRGIPDITVVANGVHRIIFDAKNRMVVGTTRSEETYKMLGYFENFRTVLGGETNWGILAFVSQNGFSRRIAARSGRVLELISAHPTSFEDCNFLIELQKILFTWISCIHGTS